MAPHDHYRLAAHAVEPVTRGRARRLLEHLGDDLRRRASLGMQARAELTDVLLQALRFPLQRFAGRGRQRIFPNNRTVERRVPGNLTAGPCRGCGEQIGMPAAQTIADDARELAVCAEDFPPVYGERMGGLLCGLREALHGSPGREERSWYRNLDD